MLSQRAAAKPFTDKELQAMWFLIHQPTSRLPGQRQALNRAADKIDYQRRTKRRAAVHKKGFMDGKFKREPAPMLDGEKLGSLESFRYYRAYCEARPEYHDACMPYRISPRGRRAP